MKAKEIADIVLASVIDQPAHDMRVALEKGAKALQDSYEGKLTVGALATGRGASLWRQAFSQWRAACTLIVQSPDWPDHMPGKRESATYQAVSAWPTYIWAADARGFLTLYDNNCFLGWTPGMADLQRIEQLRWNFRNTTLHNKGLAYSRVAQPDTGRRGSGGNWRF